MWWETETLRNESWSILLQTPQIYEENAIMLSAFLLTSACELPF